MPKLELQEPEKFVGADMSAWRVEKWFRVEPPNITGQELYLQWFTDRKTARIAALAIGRGADYKPEEDIVLTKDGKTGYILRLWAYLVKPEPAESRE
jgi:hypothetical protein